MTLTWDRKRGQKLAKGIKLPRVMPRHSTYDPSVVRPPQQRQGLTTDRGHVRDLGIGCLGA